MPCSAPRVRAIGGYPGGNEMNLAMQRGEVDGRCGIGWGAVKVTSSELIRDKQLKVLLQTAIDKHPDLPDVPTAYEMVKGADDRKALEVIFANQKVGRPFVAPPDMPADRRTALRHAFDDTMKDPTSSPPRRRRRSSCSRSPAKRSSGC